MEEETAKKTTLTENKSETAEKEPKSTNAEADEKNSRPKISLLKLKSMNGINTAMEGILPHDQTPTPTKFLKKVEDIFGDAEKKKQEGSAKASNPFDAQFKAETPEPGVSGNNLEGPDGEAAEILQTDCPPQDHEEIISDGNVHKEVVIEEDVIEDGQDSDKQFKRPTDMPKDASSLATAPLPVTSTSGGVSVAQVVTTSGAQVVSQQTTSPGMIFLNANGQQLTSPTRVVQIGSDQIQNGQANSQIIMSSGGAGSGQTPMILSSPLPQAVGGQFILAPQVIQVQDPQTGAIQQVLQAPQQPQFIQVQTMDQSSQRQGQNSQNGGNNPPAYSQCLMVSPQMQIVQPGIQQFQMVPTGNSMLVNQQGAQVQIINHGSIAQGGQIVQSVANGQQATQIQTTQISSDQLSRNTSITELDSSMDSSITLNGSRDKSMMDLDSPRGRPGYSRPSYTHRPSQIGLNNVVQLSKESLQAIEQAGQECGSGKRGGPRLNYEELDPKRRRFLERNRQAAARCRERKKQWIVSLEARANELKMENQQTEEDIVRLKAKLNQLRDALEMRGHQHQNGIDKENSE